MASFWKSWALGAAGAAALMAMACGNAGQAGLGGTTNVGYSGGQSPFARSDARDPLRNRGTGGSGTGTTGTDTRNVAMPMGSGSADVSGDSRGDLITYRLAQQQLEAEGQAERLAPPVAKPADTEQHEQPRVVKPSAKSHRR